MAKIQLDNLVSIDRKKILKTQFFSSGLNKEDHMVVAHRLGEMEKRRVGTRFIEREATEEDQAKPLMEILAEKGINCSIM